MVKLYASNKGFIWLKRCRSFLASRASIEPRAFFVGPYQRGAGGRAPACGLGGEGSNGPDGGGEVKNGGRNGGEPGRPVDGGKGKNENGGDPGRPHAGGKGKNGKPGEPGNGGNGKNGSSSAAISVCIKGRAAEAPGLLENDKATSNIARAMNFFDAIAISKRKFVTDKSVVRDDICDNLEGYI